MATCKCCGKEANHPVAFHPACRETEFEKALGTFCDGYCRWPLECASEEELEEKHCDNCGLVHMMNLGLTGGKVCEHGKRGRALPADYCCFQGDGQHNCFRQEYGGSPAWDWRRKTPYETGNGRPGLCGRGAAMTAIKRLRMQRGITQKQLAEAVGTIRQVVYSWECGKARPSDKYLLLLAAALHCRVEDIWTPPVRSWLRGYDEERIRRAGSMAPVLRRRAGAGGCHRRSWLRLRGYPL